MKGAGTLALLIALAVVAGIVLAMTRGKVTPRYGAASDRPAAEVYVERAVGLPFKTPPKLETVSQETLLEEIGAFLDGQFGPGGLARRTRVYELLELTPPGSNLRDEMIASESAGIRGWFNARTGRILVPANFNQDDPHDRVYLHGLLTRALLHQHAPMAIGRPGDDDWTAQRGVYNAIAETIEGKLREANPEPFLIPMPFETEREATILALPILLHAIAQFHGSAGQARVFVETRVETGSRALADLVRRPPLSTFELLGGDPASVSPPTLPAVEQVLLEESVGALGVRTLLEWLDDYERAQILALLWRGDRYRLYADEWGDNLIWICDWHSPEAAAKAGEILQPRADSPDLPPDQRRHRSLLVDGTRTVVANCASVESLARLTATLAIPGSPPAPTP